jgi:hypothetical protein
MDGVLDELHSSHTSFPGCFSLIFCLNAAKRALPLFIETSILVKAGNLLRAKRFTLCLELIMFSSITKFFLRPYRLLSLRFSSKQPPHSKYTATSTSHSSNNAKTSQEDDAEPTKRAPVILLSPAQDKYEEQIPRPKLDDEAMKRIEDFAAKVEIHTRKEKETDQRGYLELIDRFNKATIQEAASVPAPSLSSSLTWPLCRLSLHFPERTAKSLSASDLEEQRVSKSRLQADDIHTMEPLPLKDS